MTIHSACKDMQEFLQGPVRYWMRIHQKFGLVKSRQNLC